MRRRHRKLSFFGWLMLTLNILSAVCLVLSYAAGYISPSSAWHIAFFGLAYPVFFLLTVFFFFYWLLFRIKLSLVSLLVLLAGWSIHRNVIQLSFNDKQVSEKGNNIRVITYNVHTFQGFEKGGQKQVRAKMLDIIAGEAPAVICFQEYYSQSKGAQAITETVKKMTGCKNLYLHKTRDSDYDSFGLAIFSKYPIINKQSIPFSEKMIGNGAVFVDILVNNDTVRVFNIHLQSINFRPEDYSYLEQLKKEADPDEKSSRRIGSRLKRAFIKRSTQAEIVASHIKQSPYPVIVCGDFNDTPVSYTYHTIAKDLKNTFTEKGSGFGVTYGGEFPNFQIDYILCDQAFDVTDYKIIKKNLSDHYPVVSSLTLN